MNNVDVFFIDSIDDDVDVDTNEFIVLNVRSLTNLNVFFDEFFSFWFCNLFELINNQNYDRYVCR